MSSREESEQLVEFVAEYQGDDPKLYGERYPMPFDLPVGVLVERIAEEIGVETTSVDPYQWVIQRA